MVKQTPPLPSFIMNSVPKSGTHLLKQMLRSLPDIKHHPKHEFYEGYPRDLAKHAALLASLRPNEFGAGHIYYSQQWVNLLREYNMKHIFLSRDPRDIVVSFSHFVVEKYPHHPLRNHLTQHLKTDKERYLAFIRGVNTTHVKYPNIAIWFRQFQPWINDPHTLAITYEEITGSPSSRKKALQSIIDYLYQGLVPESAYPKLISRLEANMSPKTSFTFRSGRIGDWEKHFDEETKLIFKQVSGNLLVELGYEKNNHW